MKVNDIKEGLKDPKDNPCWKGYKPVGTKKKGGKTVPNCVPNESLTIENAGANLSTSKAASITQAPDGTYTVTYLRAPLSASGTELDGKIPEPQTGIKDLESAQRIVASIEKEEEVANSLSSSIQVNNGVKEMYGRRSSYYNPMDYERREQDAMDFEKRAFKRAELQHELGHEDDPNFERNFRQQQMDRDRGPWYLKINGKIYKQKGIPKSFDWKSGATKYGQAILKNRPELTGKIMLTKKSEDDAGDVAESKTTVKVPVTQKPRQGPLRPQTGGGAHRDKKKEQKQGKEKHKKPMYEAGELKVQKDDDKATVLVNPATGVQTQIDKTNPNAPRLTQDEQGKLKLSMAQGAQSGGGEEKPNLIGKDVSVDSAPVEDVHRVGAMGSPHGDELSSINARSTITGDEDHDEISKLLTQRLRKLAGL